MNSLFLPSSISHAFPEKGEPGERTPYLLAWHKNHGFPPFASQNLPFLVARYLLSRLKATWPIPILGFALSGSGLT